MTIPPLPPLLLPLPALCPLKLYDDLQVHVLAPGMVRLDLYGEIFDGRSCAIVNKAELMRIAKQIANALAQA